MARFTWNMDRKAWLLEPGALSGVHTNHISTEGGNWNHAVYTLSLSLLCRPAGTPGISMPSHSRIHKLFPSGLAAVRSKHPADWRVSSKPLNGESYSGFTFSVRLDQGRPSPARLFRYSPRVTTPFSQLRIYLVLTPRIRTRDTSFPSGASYH